MLNRKQIRHYGIWIGSTLLVGILAGILSADGARVYGGTIRKPPFSPPSWVFQVIWAILYILMGYVAARIYSAKASIYRSRGLNIYIIQLVVNFFWPLLFFNAQAFGFAFLWLLLLWGLVFAMILVFRRVNKQAAFLQIPYLIWLTFALYLNYTIWKINPQ